MRRSVRLKKWGTLLGMFSVVGLLAACSSGVDEATKKAEADASAAQASSQTAQTAAQQAQAAAQKADQDASSAEDSARRARDAADRVEAAFRTSVTK
jgi:hypothetical protein